MTGGTVTKQALRRHTLESLKWMVLLLAAAVTSIGCSGEVNVTTPEFPTFTSQGQGFQIDGTLTADVGSVLEATILFDGREMLGARSICAKPGGCDQLHLQAATFGATSGRHTIAFQVLRQSSSRVEYKVEGEIVPDLDTADNIALGPARATLEAGESVIFEFDHLR
ncbi:MAG: hypothetical protein WBH75_18685 [Thermoanaerobaculia bacterium]